MPLLALRALSYGPGRERATTDPDHNIHQKRATADPPDSCSAEVGSRASIDADPTHHRRPKRVAASGRSDNTADAWRWPTRRPRQTAGRPAAMVRCHGLGVGAQGVPRIVGAGRRAIPSRVCAAGRSAARAKASKAAPADRPGFSLLASSHQSPKCLAAGAGLAPPCVPSAMPLC